MNTYHTKPSADNSELLRELWREQLKYYRQENQERERERHEDALNEGLRRRGYPALYHSRRRRWR